MGPVTEKARLIVLLVSVALLATGVALFWIGMEQDSIGSLPWAGIVLLLIGKTGLIILND